MKHYPASRVRQILRDRLRLCQFTKGDASGHERWGTADGRYVRPMLRTKEVSFGSLFSLGQSLEAQGFIERRAFLALLRQQ